MQVFANSGTTIERETRDRQLALEYIAEAWNSAESDGLHGEALSHAAIFAALATLVKTFGEEVTADLIAQLPDRIRHGEYSLDKSIQ